MKTAITILSLALCSCDTSPPIPRHNVTMRTPDQRGALEVVQSRITVDRIGVFLDDTAYSKERGIYIIRDNQTGKELVGISGIGISELGSHTSNDNTVQDER